MPVAGIDVASSNFGTLLNPQCFLFRKQNKTEKCLTSKGLVLSFSPVPSENRSSARRLTMSQAKRIVVGLVCVLLGGVLITASAKDKHQSGEVHHKTCV